MLHLIAQATQPAPGAGTVNPPWWTNPTIMLYAVLALGIVFIFSLSGRANSKQEKQHRKMLENLKRGDRVQTIGGILGSVVEARENELVLKVDESTNTKIRVVRDAVKKMVLEESETQDK
jgi:preprotein translocase subunit YajC